MSLDLSSSLRYPLNDEDAKKKILIGGACFFPGIVLLAIPMVFLWGYGISALRKVIRGEENELPDWELMSDHFRFGLHTLLISLGYYLIPTLVTVVSVGGAAFQLLAGHTDVDGQSSVGVFFVLGATVSSILCLMAAFLLPMAIMTYATSDDLGAGFHVGAILDKIKSNLKAYVLLVVVNLVISFICWFPQSFLSNLPVIGILGLFAGGLLATYGMLVMAHLNGTWYREHFGSHVGAHIHTTEGTGLEKDRWQKSDDDEE